MSLLTLTAKGVDRLLALLLGLRYRQVVTLKRTYLTVIVFMSRLYSHRNHALLERTFGTSWYGMIVLSLCLVTSIFSYTKICVTLRHNHSQVQNHVSQGQPSQVIPLNIARYRKAVFNALWVQVTLLVCYVPLGIVIALTPHRGSPFSVFVTWEYTTTLVYVNLSLNLLLYCWKIRKVRQALKDTIRQIYFLLFIDLIS